MVLYKRERCISAARKIPNQDVYFKGNPEILPVSQL